VGVRNIRIFGICDPPPVSPIEIFTIQLLLSFSGVPAVTVYGVIEVYMIIVIIIIIIVVVVVVYIIVVYC